MIAAITAYNISLWLHISAVVVGFGATFAEALAFPVAMKMDPRHLPYVHRLGVAVGRHGDQQGPRRQPRAGDRHDAAQAEEPEVGSCAVDDAHEGLRGPSPVDVG